IQSIILQASKKRSNTPPGCQNSRTPRVPDIDVADLEIHSIARSSVPFNHQTCPAEDIEWMNVKNPTYLTLPSPSQGEGQGGGKVFGGFSKGAMILHASRAGFRSSESLAIIF